MSWRVGVGLIALALAAECAAVRVAEDERPAPRARTAAAVAPRCTHRVQSRPAPGVSRSRPALPASRREL